MKRSRPCCCQGKERKGRSLGSGCVDGKERKWREGAMMEDRMEGGASEKPASRSATTHACSGPAPPNLMSRLSGRGQSNLRQSLRRIVPSLGCCQPTDLRLLLCWPDAAQCACALSLVFLEHRCECQVTLRSNHECSGRWEKPRRRYVVEQNREGEMEDSHLPTSYNKTRLDPKDEAWTKVCEAKRNISHQQGEYRPHAHCAWVSTVGKTS